MKEHPIIFSTGMVRAILDGRKTQTRRVITKYNSVIGEGSDWNKLCWNGSQEYNDTCHHGHTEIRKAPMPFVDSGNKNYQYLHVPYNFEKNNTIYRVYPKWDVGDVLWVRETFVLESDIDYRYSETEIQQWANDRPVKTVDGGFDEGIYHLIPHYKATEPEPNLVPWGLDSHDDRTRWRPSIHMPRWASRINLEIKEIKVERVQDITIADIQAEGITMSPLVISDNNMILEFHGLWDSINAKRSYSWSQNPWVWVIKFKGVKCN